MHGQWRKSSFSEAGQINCVEVAYSATLRIRDSKNPDGGELRFPDTAWAPQLLAHSHR
ncbi:MAG TPA: DUF397 domain-containing protein [Actinokineospora sp.]|nr:DUF397 domain-containing protein [Actinokineospora sp.]